MLRKRLWMLSLNVLHNFSTFSFLKILTKANEKYIYWNFLHEVFVILLSIVNNSCLRSYSHKFTENNRLFIKTCLKFYFKWCRNTLKKFLLTKVFYNVNESSRIIIRLKLRRNVIYIFYLNENLVRLSSHTLIDFTQNYCFSFDFETCNKWQRKYIKKWIRSSYILIKMKKKIWYGYKVLNNM